MTPYRTIPSNEEPENKAWLGINLGRGISGFIVPEQYELYGTEARIDSPNAKMNELLHELLSRIGFAHPQALIYPWVCHRIPPLLLRRNRNQQCQDRALTNCESRDGFPVDGFHYFNRIPYNSF